MVEIHHGGAIKFVRINLNYLHVNISIVAGDLEYFALSVFITTRERESAL